MLRSSASITPCSWLSLTSRRISSSLTWAASVSDSRSTRSSACTLELSRTTAGLAAREMPCMGRAITEATRSGASSARRLGSSSPNTMVR